MWNMTNEYNTPAEQLKRLREAGLNPLFYGLDGSSASAMQSAQALGYERAEMRPQDNPLQAGLDAYLKTKTTLAQEKLAGAEARKSEKEADLAEAKAITENLMRDRTYNLLGVQIDLETARKDMTNAEIRKLGAEIQQVEKSVDKMDAEITEIYNSMDISKRGMALQEATFEFEK